PFFSACSHLLQRLKSDNYRILRTIRYAKSFGTHPGSPMTVDTIMWITPCNKTCDHDFGASMHRKVLLNLDGHAASILPELAVGNQVRRTGIRSGNCMGVSIR